MKTLLVASLLFISWAWPALASANPAEALLDFKVEFGFPAGTAEVNFVALDVCSRKAIAQNFGARMVDNQPEMVDPDRENYELHPKLQNCAPLNAYSTHVSSMDSRFALQTREWSAAFTATELYRKAIAAGIAIDDATLVISFWWARKTYYGFDGPYVKEAAYVGHRAIDLLSVPVQGVNENTPAAELEIPKAGITKVLARMSELSGLAPENINVPMAALRPYVIRKILGKADGQALILADYVKLSLIYYSTRSHSVWGKLEKVSQAAMRMGGELGAEFADLASLARYRQIMNLSWADSLKAYLYVYKDNLQEVLFAFTTRKKEIVEARGGSSFGVGGTSYQERLAQYELYGRVTADSIGAIGAAAQGGLSIINAFVK
jgi:hypothetical protein